MLSRPELENPQVSRLSLQNLFLDLAIRSTECLGGEKLRSDRVGC